ncbi:MAG: hypothetical protein M3431_13660, partial [Actinomycetota bacterium]|nr:hypothetical protein [Actinomycetota bacterium]
MVAASARSSMPWKQGEHQSPSSNIADATAPAISATRPNTPMIVASTMEIEMSMTLMMRPATLAHIDQTVDLKRPGIINSA